MPFFDRGTKVSNVKSCRNILCLLMGKMEGPRRAWTPHGNGQAVSVRFHRGACTPDHPSSRPTISLSPGGPVYTQVPRIKRRSLGELIREGPTSTRLRLRQGDHGDGLTDYFTAQPKSSTKQHRKPGQIKHEATNCPFGEPDLSDGKPCVFATIARNSSTGIM